MSGIESAGDEEEFVKKSGKPCEGSKKELVECLRESECIRVSVSVYTM